ncbi:MAG: hypothetical protein JWP91_3942 [Fibrobacteres bacterium]|nr:hypothetical protein [Fibrobacterota bacterium]
MEANAQDQLSKRCAKCLAPMPNPDWVVNKDMAYCADCASLLHLGESKESRMFNDMKDKSAVPGAGISPDEIPIPIPDEDDVEEIPD